MSDRKTLLLVEDDAVVAMLEGSMLRKEGYEVICASTAREAIAIVEAMLDGLDLVLMDINLGEGMNGIEAAREILKIHDIPILFLSSYTDRDIVEKTEQITSYGYVVKNTGIIVLVASIRMAFKLYEANRNIRAKNAEIEAINYALSASENHLTTVLENTPDFILQVDRNGKTLFANRAFPGISREAITGSNVFEWISKEAYQDFYDALEAAFSQRQTRECEVFGPGPDGIPRMYQVRVAPVYANDRVDSVILIARDVTERKAVEGALRESEEKFSKAFRHAPVGMMISNPENGAIVEANQKFLELSGLSPEGAAGTSLTDLGWQWPVDRQQLIGELKSKGRVADLELTLENLITRQQVHILYHGEFIMTNGQQRLLSICSDITQRKRIEETLLFLAHCGSSGTNFFEELARYLAEKLSMDYVCIDRLMPENLEAHTLAIYYDGRFEDNVTYTLDETPCGEVVDQTVCCYPRGVRHIFPRDVILQEMKAESYVGVTLWGAKGQPIGLIAVIGRRTLPDPSLAEAVLKLVAVRAAGELERMQAEAKLRASEERYRTLVEISADPISMTDLEGQFLAVNPAGLQNLGFDSLESLQKSGLTSYQLIVEEDRPRARENTRKVLETGMVRNAEYRLRRMDGSILPVEISASVLRDKEGNPIAFIGVTHDISARKQAEEIQARMLKEKSILLSDLQHRIKNSLNLIISLISLERDVCTEEETRMALEGLLGRIHSLSGLYTILYESKNSQQVQLDQYLTRVVQTLSDSYLPKARHISVKVACDEIQSSARRAAPFGLILNELLTNALKYAFPGGYPGTIWVNLSQVGGHVVLEVMDNGVGLPAGLDLEHPTGLGLQIVNLLVSELHGMLSYQRDGKTGFRIQVPREVIVAA